MADTCKALFGAGCFWGVQYYFDQVPGVVKTTVGYSGGRTVNPDYYSIHDNETGHVEVTLVEYDPAIVSYDNLVRHFFRMHNPTLFNSDGINVGSTYRSALFYFDQQQLDVANRVKAEFQKMYAEPIVTEIAAAGPFYEAEPFHQKFTERTGRGTCHVAYAPIDGEVTALPSAEDKLSGLRNWLTRYSR